MNSTSVWWGGLTPAATMEKETLEMVPFPIANCAIKTLPVEETPSLGGFAASALMPYKQPRGPQLSLLRWDQICPLIYGEKLKVGRKWEKSFPVASNSSL